MSARGAIVAGLCALAAACVPGPYVDDQGVEWREVLMQAGVADPMRQHYPRIRELTLEEATHVLGPCLGWSADCGDALLAAHADLRGAALERAWPWALRDMSPRLVPALLSRGAVADQRAIVTAIERRIDRPDDREERLTIMRHLLDAGGPVDALDSDGETPLHHAARQGDTALARPAVAARCGSHVQERCRSGAAVACAGAGGYGDRRTVECG